MNPASPPADDSQRPKNAVSKLVILFVAACVIIKLLAWRFPGNTILANILIAFGVMAAVIVWGIRFGIVAIGMRETWRSTGKSGFWAQTGVVVGKVFLYLFVPAIIITAILFGVMYVLHPEYFTT